MFRGDAAPGAGRERAWKIYAALPAAPVGFSWLFRVRIGCTRTRDTNRSQGTKRRRDASRWAVEVAECRAVGRRRGDDDDGGCSRRGAPRWPGSPAHLERRRFNQRRHSTRLAKTVRGPGRVSHARQLLLRRDQLGCLERQAGLALMRARRALRDCARPRAPAVPPDACFPRGRRVMARTLRKPRG